MNQKGVMLGDGKSMHGDYVQPIHPRLHRGGLTRLNQDDMGSPMCLVASIGCRCLQAGRAGGWAQPPTDGSRSVSEEAGKTGVGYVLAISVLNAPVKNIKTVISCW